MKKRSLLFRAVFGVVLAAFCVCGGLLAYRLLESRRSELFYRQIAASCPEPSSTEAPSAALPEDPAAAALPELCMRVGTGREAYPDLAVWLRIPDTKVDYPVMQGADNARYLNRLPDGSFNALGSLFLDCRNGEDSHNLVIYGHNASSGAMFGTLKSYRDQTYYEAHPTIQLATEQAEYDCRIFSVRRVDAYEDAYTLDFAGETAFLDYCRQAAEDSLYKASPAPEAGERIVTLSTCTGGARSERFIVQAVLTPKQQE